MIRRPIQIMLMLTALATAGAARAEAAGPPMSKIVWSKPPALDLVDPRLYPAAAYAGRVRAPDPTGIRRTSIDHAFDPGMVGSLGYLCGLAPGPNESSGVASSHEARGTFLGGKLTMALGR